MNKLFLRAHLTSVLKYALTIAVLFSVRAGASKPTIIKQAGKPVTAVWPSGNEAQLKIGGGSILVTPIEFKVTENSCRADVGQKFTGRFAITANLMLWMWTKHSDDTKVNRPLTRGSVTLADVFIFSNGTHFRFPDLANDLPMDRIEPTDMSFIPGLEGPFRAFTIEQWLSESMRANPETGVMENRISFSGSGVHINSNGDIESIDSAGEMGKGGNALALIGDVVTWIVNTPRGICQVSFKPDLGPAQQMLREYLSSIKGPFIPYDWESSGISTLLQEAVKSPLRDSYVEAADE